MKMDHWYHHVRFRPSILPCDTSTNDTVLLETQIIHRLVHRFFNLLPVRPALDELVNVLRESV